MLFKKLLTNGCILLKRKNSLVVNNCVRNIRISCKLCDEDNKNKEPTALVYKTTFEDMDEKNKKTYLEMVKIFTSRDTVYRRGHVEFIYSALKNMEDFGVHKDLEVYKAILDVLPKGRIYISTNIS